MVRQTLACGRPDYLHALFDAAAGQADAGVRAVCDLVDEAMGADRRERNRDPIGAAAAETVPETAGRGSSPASERPCCGPPYCRPARRGTGTSSSGEGH